MTLRTLTVAVFALALAVSAYAHEGHDHKIMGTVAAIHENRLEVKGTDGKPSTMTVDAKTKVLRGTSAVRLGDIRIGERIVVTATEVKDKQGKTAMIAKQVNLAPSPSARK